MAGITIKNPLPAELVALSEETIEKRDSLLEASVAARRAITDEASYRSANAVYKDLHAFGRAVEAGRKDLKRPILDIGAALDAAAHEAMEPIDAEKQALGRAIADYERIENARREEERKKAEAEARAREEAERKRLEEEARQRAEMDAPPGAPVQEPDFGAIPTVRPIAPAPTPAPLKGAVRTSVRKKVVITDASKVPFEMNGLRLWKEPDPRAIEMLQKQGVTVPGCEYVDDVVIGAKGR